MKYFEVEKYIDEVKTFFNDNPNDLYSLIGNLNVEKFYQKIKIISEKNYIDEGIVELTQKQFIDIVVEMYEEIGVKAKTVELSPIFYETKFGRICLN